MAMIGPVLTGSDYAQTASRSTAIRIGRVGYTGYRGVVGAPPIAFEEDQDTGIYSAGANQLSFTAGGTQLINLKAPPLNSASAIGTYTTTTNASGTTLGFQTKPAQGVATTGAVVGAEFSPRVLDTFNAGGLTGLQVNPIAKGSSGTITDFRGLEINMEDDGSTAGRVFTNQPAMIRMYVGMKGHTMSGGSPVGLLFENPGDVTGWGAAIKFASATGIAGTCTTTTTVNGFIKVILDGSTVGYIATYASHN